jgi:type 1 glutamine amidotransferase
VLVVTETRGYRHASIPAAEARLKALGADDSRYGVEVLDSASELTPKRLADADAVVFANTTGTLRMTAAQRDAFIRFIRNGGGFLGAHSAADTFHNWPAYLRMLGGEFEHHPPNGVARIAVEDRTHPATTRLPRSFTIRDEFYRFVTNPRRRAHVLARVDEGSRGPDLPIIWCRDEGRGRVFYDGLGHFPETWSDARQVRIVRGALQWILRLAPARGTTKC